MTRRRSFLTLLGGAAAAWPLAAKAQQSTMPVVGFLHQSTRVGYAHNITAFHQGLGESGFVEGRNVAVDYRFAEDQLDRLPSLAAELVRRRVDVIAACPTMAALAAKAATATTPIVFVGGTDPIKAGLIASFNRPGGNVTGILEFTTPLIGKRLELLHEAVPNATLIGVLVQPNAPPAPDNLAEVQAGAQRIGKRIRVLNATSQEQFEEIFATIGRERVGALLVSNDPLFTAGRERLVELAARYSVPASYEYRQFVEAGGLMSYGSNQTESYRNVGIYVGRILKGEKPADMPILQPTRFSFAINLKTAKALGLDLPLKLQAFADEVIE